MKDFGDEFDMLLACEIPHARRDAARMADLLSKLAEGPGLVLAIAGAKRPEGPGVLADATANRVIESAAEQAPLAHRIVGGALMTWRLHHDGAVVARGTYAQILDLAEEWRVLERTYHLDGTELAPRWLVRGYAMRPERAGAARRRAA